MTTNSPAGDDVTSPFNCHPTEPFAASGCSAPRVPVMPRGTLPDRPPAFRKLVASLQQVYLSLYAAEVGVWEWDVSENTVSWSLCVDKIFGLSPKRAKPSCAELFRQIAPEDLARGRSLLAQVLKTGVADAPFEFRCRIRRPDGELRWIEVVGSVGQSAALSVLGTVRDVTERRLAEEAEHRGVEARLLHAQRLDNLGSVASGIAHELKNILTPIIIHTQMLKEDLGASHSAQTGLNEVMASCRRADSLLQQILTFSRRQEPRPVPVRLQDVVAEAVKLLKATIPASVTLKASIAGNLPMVHADPTQIQQVVLNLGINAWHAVEAGNGVVEISLDEVMLAENSVGIPQDLAPGRYVRLSVRDNGTGMDDATLARIFEPFFTTKPNGMGTGLGLSVVEEIVRKHLGGMTVESRPGQGACFRIYFPAPPAAGSRPTT